MKINSSEQSEQNTQQSSGLPQSNISSSKQTTGTEKNEGVQNGAQSLINLPKGGGAIQGIGEKFETNPVTGTFSMGAPIAISPGRNGFTPQLGLAYNSGSGNSPFGLGWGVGIPNITRKTDKGLPLYDDINESDTFILSGAEDLVPADELPRVEGNFSIKRYMPRTEGLFAQIERWHNTVSGDVHWQTISKENVVSVYGRDTSARIAHPNDTQKVFSWYLQETYDAKGNLMRYTYLKENKDNVPSEVYESHRLNGNKAFNNLYLDKVLYGNTVMYDPGNTSYSTDWLFTLAFDYGNYSTYSTSGGEINPSSTWEVRQDTFSVYRAGFEMRTYRLCQRVLMFHHFTELGADPVLVKSTHLHYTKDAHMAQLNSVVHTSHNGGESANMPPLTFSYSESIPGSKVYTVDADQLENLPQGADSAGWQWADLYGEGINSLLKTDNEAWHYKPNLGDTRWTDDENNSDIPQPEFGKLQQLDLKPNVKQANNASFYLGDVDGNSEPEMVVNASGVHGYYSFENGEWQNFRAFENMPNINMGDPNIKQIDLSGDGMADMLISHGDYFELYLSAGKEGYKGYRKISMGHDEDLAPVVLFADAERSVYLADMTGDGLSDIVRIKNNSVCYWPNLGYGRFGEKVLMKNPPLLDSPDLFNPSRIRLADVDGTGTTDIIYLDTSKVRYFKNQAGNTWSNNHFMAAFPHIDHLSQVSVVDLMGNGTSCLVWTSPLPQHQFQIKFVELTSGIKPYLLTNFENGLGRRVNLHYAPSTKFFVQDKKNGKPWITRLPFPVQVLEKVEDHEMVSDTKIVSRYAYHHGHYDVHEREFRGFGMVEQWDTEFLTDAPEGYQSPVYSKSWFHTGIYDNKETISTQFVQEYFNGDADAWELPDSVLPIGLTAQEEREACRAMRGQLLRSEVYAQDGSAQEHLPYLVEEKNMTVKLIQAKGDNKHAVLMPIANEAFQYHYERNVADPRIAHTVTLNTDTYGNVLNAIQIAYPRRDADASDEQKSLKVICSQTDYINRSETGLQLIGVPCESKSFEMTGLSYTHQPFDKETLQAALDFAKEINFAQSPSTDLEKRCFQHQKNLFYNNDLNDSLPVGQIAHHALPYGSLSCDLTDDLLKHIDASRTKYTLERLANEANYVYEPGTEENPGKWWIPSETMTFDAARFYMPVQQTDAFGNTTHISYDAYSLMPVQTRDALGFETMATLDYRVLQVKEITDANGNMQKVAFDTRGMVTAVALVGKNGEGDTLDNPTMQYSYNLMRWIDEQKPVQSHITLRTEHGTGNTVWMESYEYSGGWGNMVMTKVQAEDGEALQIASDGSVETVQTNNRWVGNGRTIVNNKGSVIKQYERYFSTTHEYENENALTQHGVTPIMYYDPMGRNIQTNLPDGTLTRIEFTPWMQSNYDQVDTVTESTWYENNGSPNPLGAEPTDPQQRAAWMAAKHAYTPQVRYFDNLGREYLVEDDNAKEGIYRVHNKLDIAGRPLIVTDAKGRKMTQNTFGMQQALKVFNIDSGTRYALADVAGKPLYAWHNREHQTRNTYDALQRPLATYLKEAAANEIKVQEQVYGTNANDNNIGQVKYHYDQSGRTLFAYDFKGNPATTTKTFAQEYKAYINWDASVLLSPSYFIHSFEYDAINRPVSKTLPNGKVETYTYNKAGLLETLSNDGQSYVTNINYNEKGQRTEIYYGNGTKTKYVYDAQSFRLKRLLTTRNSGAEILQDLNYTYDAVGNIVEQVDHAQQTHYFNNAVVEPRGKYEYDALYRLTKATGRELNSLQLPSSADFVNNIPNPNMAANAMQNYTHKYTYDELGNMQKVNNVGQWTRDYFYNTTDNYLLGHSSGTTEYTYDAHGNMLTMPHLQALHWDYNDWLTHVELDAADNKSYYVYNAGGERVRKVVEKGNIREERYYFGDYEIYHKFVSDVLETERTTVNISDDDKKIATAETLTVHQGSLTVNPVAVIRYQYDNHLGSASLELDENANIISYEEYHPFGTTSYRSGRTETETSQKRYKYVGKERDEETGLYYYGFRFYTAWLCRFVSVDPDANKYPALTPFCNAANNPITLTDYKGRGPVFGKEKAKGANYVYGFGYGFVDAAAETMDFLNSAAYLAIYMGRKQSTLAEIGHVGLSLFDSNYRAFSDTMDQIPDMLLGVAQQFVENEEFRNKVVTNLISSISAIPGSIGTYFKELTFQEGYGVAGYQHGKVVFEVLLEIATSGSSSLRHLAPLLKKGGKELTEFLVKQGVPELLESKFTRSFVDPSDAVKYTRRVAGKHHFLPRALGNDLPYGHKSLTGLGSEKHTILQGALDDYLASVKKTLPDGSSVDMLARKGNNGSKIRKNFTLEERINAVDNFYKNFDNGSYYPAFRMELNAAMKANKLK